MQKVIDALGLLVKVLLSVLAFLVVGGMALIALVMWSDSNKEIASNECFLRRMDHRIAETSTGTYHDTCMAALGYRRVGACYSGNLIAAPPFCFAPAWQAWK